MFFRFKSHWTYNNGIYTVNLSTVKSSKWRKSGFSCKILQVYTIQSRLLPIKKQIFLVFLAVLCWCAHSTLVYTLPWLCDVARLGRPGVDCYCQHESGAAVLQLQFLINEVRQTLLQYRLNAVDCAAIMSNFMGCVVKMNPRLFIQHAIYIHTYIWN